MNLWGMIHGIHTFVPRMLAQGDPGQIVNTSSMARLFAPPVLDSYAVTKHAVIALSEILCVQLAQHGSDLRIAVLCPSPAATRFAEDTVGLGDDPATIEVELAGIRGPMQDHGMAPRMVANRLFSGLCDGLFYILTDNWVKPQVQQRLEEILKGRSSM